MARGTTSRKVSVRSLSNAIGGPERAYDVYRFSGGRTRYERPNHNPFEHLRASTAYTTGFDQLGFK